MFEESASVHETKKIQVVVEESETALNHGHTISAGDVARSFEQLLANNDFVANLNVGIQSLLNNNERCVITGARIRKLQEGALEYIFQADLKTSNGKDLPVIFATSKGQFSQTTVDEMWEAQSKETKEAHAAAVYKAYLQEMGNRQVKYDYDNLGYLHDQFQRKKLPVAVPKPLAYSEVNVKPAKGNSQRISVLALEMLRPPEGGFGGEINPAWMTTDKLPNYGHPWYWRVNNENDKRWNDNMINYPKMNDESIDLMSLKTAELLSYVYFASGKLPYCFSPSAGDMVMLAEFGGGLKEEDFNLGLITTRGGMVSVEHDFIPGGGDKEGRLLIPQNLSWLREDKLQVIEKPDISGLLDKLMQMRVEVNTFDYDGNVRDHLTTRTVPLFSDRQMAVRGVLKAISRFYPDNPVRDVASQLRLPESIAQEQKIITMNYPPTMNDAEVIDCVLVAQEIVKKMDVRLTRQLKREMPTEADLRRDLDHVAADRTTPLNFMPLSEESAVYSGMIFGQLLGTPIEESIQDPKRNEYIFKLDKKFVGGRENLYLKLMINRPQKRAGFEIFSRS